VCLWHNIECACGSRCDEVTKFFLWKNCFGFFLEYSSCRRIILKMARR
jgi:hypothetical protein